jgi:hypothetical protein
MTRERNLVCYLVAAKLRIHQTFPSIVSGILRFIIAGVYTILSALIVFWLSSNGSPV